MGAYDRELVATMANLGATTNGTTPDSRGNQAPYLRTLTMQGMESRIGQTERMKSNRHNAYRAPGGLEPLADGLTSASCAHAADSGDAPPCKVQAPWSFAGAPPRYFPHVEPASTGGVMGTLARLLALGRPD
jgi:hypothetical protein